MLKRNGRIVKIVSERGERTKNSVLLNLEGLAHNFTYQIMMNW